MKKYSPALKAAAAGSIALLALTACASNEGGTGDDTGSSLSGTLSGAGASAQDAAQQAWIAGFQTANPDVTINYDPVGSGAGRETFQEGASSFAGSDAAFDTEEIAAGPFESCATDAIIEIPAYISPIAIIFNLEGIDSVNMSADTIAKVFNGDITQWNDPEIADQNDGVDLPDLAISTVVRSDSSGTTENFTEYLNAAAPDAWTHGVVEDWPNISGADANQGTSGVVDAVTNGTGTIGYADASRAGDLGTIAVGVGGEYVPYSAEAAAKIVDVSPVAEGRTDGDLAIDLDRTSTEEGVYPIVLVSYLIGCEQYNDAANAELVKAYFEYIISEEGQSASASEAGSAPMSADLRGKAEPIVAAIS